MTNRRMFLQTAGAAAAFPLVGGELVLARSQEPDPVAAELLRQLEELAAPIKAGKPISAEIMRRHASNLRVRAAHFRRYDAQMRRELRREISRHGRDRFTPPNGDVVARDAALEQLLQFGLTPMFVRAAAVLEREATRVGPLQQVRQIQDPCYEMRVMLAVLAAAETFWCSPLGELVAPVAALAICVGLTIDIVVWTSTMIYNGCV